MEKQSKGYVQVYTGNGKGKSTASFGLALRAVGAGYKVFIGQFLKGQDYSELKSFELLAPNVEVVKLGGECFIFGDPSEEDYVMAKEGLALCEKKLTSGEFDIVILDEINVALYFKVITEEDLLALIDKKPEHVELILTGRYASEKVIERADLVTEMKEIKHYYNIGVDARVGIES